MQVIDLHPAITPVSFYPSYPWIRLSYVVIHVWICLCVFFHHSYFRPCISLFHSYFDELFEGDSLQVTIAGLKYHLPIALIYIYFSSHRQQKLWVGWETSGTTGGYRYGRNCRWCQRWWWFLQCKKETTGRKLSRQGSKRFCMFEYTTVGH